MAFAVLAGLASWSPQTLANADADAVMVKVKTDTGIDVKKVFASQCGLCHGDFGMAMGGRGGGPKLAGTKLDHDGVKNRILDGKSGLMPSFKKMLKPEEVEAMALYIKSLPSK
ncbi:MAG: c-type cytochrome [Burkholderiales bacterium]